jgi:hypothetical protein
MQNYTYNYVFAISTLAVFAHHIFGSVQDLSSSYIYILYLPAPPTFLLAFHFATPLFSLCICSLMCYHFVVSSRTICIILTSLPPATKLAQLIFRNQNYVSKRSNTLCMCIYTMSIHSAYVVSDLEGSDNGGPINGIICCLGCESRSSHGLGNP